MARTDRLVDSRLAMLRWLCPWAAFVLALGEDPYEVKVRNAISAQLPG
jgi:hypothetical protein